MKRALNFFLFILFIFLCSCSLEHQSNNDNSVTVYVCTGTYSKKYHSDKQCRGLGNCKGDIVSESESSAIKNDKSKCSICY